MSVSYIRENNYRCPIFQSSLQHCSEVTVPCRLLREERKPCGVFVVLEALLPGNYLVGWLAGWLADCFQCVLSMKCFSFSLLVKTFWCNIFSMYQWIWSSKLFGCTFKAYWFKDDSLVQWSMVKFTGPWDSSYVFIAGVINETETVFF